MILLYSSRFMLLLLTKPITRFRAMANKRMSMVAIGGCCRLLKSAEARLDSRFIIRFPSALLRIK